MGREIAHVLVNPSQHAVSIQSRLDALLGKLQPELGFEALSLPLPNGKFVYGTLSPGQEVLALPHSQDSAIRDLRVYFPGIDKEMAQERKRILISIGLLVIGFGLMLKFILHRLLSCPFTRMMDTARRFTDGEMDARFNIPGSDEFSFLSSFINHALDAQSSQQKQLQHAIARATQSEAELFAEKELLDVTLHSITDAVITADAQGNVQYLNPTAERLAGMRSSHAKALPITELIHLQTDHDGQPVVDPLTRCLKSVRPEVIREAASLVGADGIAVAVEASAAPMLDRQGAVIGAVMICQDVSHARQLTTQLTYQACHDALTGLINRREFEHRLTMAIDSAHLHHSQHALMFLDLDRFKVVNDTCGHDAGDQLLIQLAALLSQQLRSSDALARLGGDEFGVLLEGCSLESGLKIAQSLLQTVSEFRFTCQDKLFQIGVSIGMVTIDAETDSLSGILSAADAACYAAKDGGRNRIELFADNGGGAQKPGEAQWISRIHAALADHRMHLYWQRIVYTDGRNHGMDRAEFLLRMKDEEGGLIPPMAFIPAAERYNIMPLIDPWVVKHAFEWLARRPSPALPRIGYFSINLSAQSLGDQQLLPYIKALFAETGVSPASICFEITETAAIAHIGHARILIDALKTMGCTFALDDFGSGMSSYSCLKNLDVDFIKIDGAFVRDILSDPVDLEMVRSIHRIGRIMGIETIAECIESEAVLARLTENGVTYAQGNWIHTPEPLPD